MRYALFFTTALSTLAFNSPAHAADDIQTLSQELKAMKANYEQKISSLESRINQLEAEKKTAPPAANVAVTNAAPPSNPNSFNPAIGVVLNGQFGAFSQKDSNISGFAIGDEGERPSKGFSLGESELSFNANIDDKFAGSLVASVSSEGGIDVEEAFIQTLGLPYGANIKAGRMLASIGYMNEKHAHTDDFVDRPLPYRAFLNGAFNDDGVQASFVLPTDFYSEIGGGIWRGDDFPAADAQASRPGAYTAYTRIGGDIGDNQNWRLGASYLHGRADGDGRVTGEGADEQTFKGDDDIYIADAKYNWAPTGNAQNQEVSLQGEYFWRKEDGTYADTSIGAGDTPYDQSQSGWYAQGIYKFLPEWRIGYRYTELSPSDVPIALAGGQPDAAGHDPFVHSAMIDWTNSEFSRIRLQYNDDNTGPETDHQFLAQYIVSLGAHGAHKY